MILLMLYASILGLSRINHQQKVCLKSTLAIEVILLLSGSKFEIWVRGYSSQFDARACLGCFALNGFHKCTNYEWFQNEKLIASEKTPLLYTAKEGNYLCRVTHRDEQLVGAFEITCKWGTLKSY